MKKVLLTVAAAATLATALPAAAQSYGPQRHGYGGWTPIEQRIDRLDNRIDRGVERGAITRREAFVLRTQLRDLVRLSRHYARDGLNRWEREDLDRRFDGLSARIRFERRDDDRRGRDGRWDAGRRY